MMGKGASVSQSQPRPCSGMKTLKRCKNNGEDDNVVLIDVDGDCFNNVIIIDVPESLTKNLQGSKGLRKDKKCPLKTYIYIDDDESPNNHPRFDVEDDGEFNDGASSSNRFGSASNRSRHTGDEAGNQCHFGQENMSPLKLSKCKRTYSGKAFNNRYGFSTDSDSASSGNDGPDCECMEDSSGQLREQWEKASLKRKYDVHNAQSGRRGQGSASRSSTDAHEDVGVVNKGERHPEALVRSDRANVSHDREDQSPTVKVGCTSSVSKDSPADNDLDSNQRTCIHRERAANVELQKESLAEDFSCCNPEQQNQKHFEQWSSSFFKDGGRSHQGVPISPMKEQDNKQGNYRQEDKIPHAEHSSSDPNDDVNVSYSKASVAVDEASGCHDKCSVETQVKHVSLVSGNRDEKCEQAPYPSKSHLLSVSRLGKYSFERSEKSDLGKSVHGNAQQSDENPVNHCVTSTSNEKIGAVPDEALTCKFPSAKLGICKKKHFNQEKGESVPEEPSFGNILSEKIQFQRETWSLAEVEKACVESVSNHREEDERNGDAVLVESCIINEREKLKETDEYKRALEQELLARQRALQIQAEEAQNLRRLRKRKKAETLRILDVERRQKQRVEEIRETQKKDEEKMTLKEQHRTEVRKELSKLETTCRDMASLLRGLGIQVGGGLHPLSHEVRAAYKRALLSFHPDRASGSDMRMQVEAEEKFKLISRMKDKLLPTS